MSEKRISEDYIIESIMDILEGRVNWDFQCPPEKIGAQVALLHLLGFSWEESKEIALECVTEVELRDFLEENL